METGLSLMGKFSGPLTKEYDALVNEGEIERAIELLSPYVVAGDPEAMYLRSLVFLREDSEGAEGANLSLLQESAAKGYLPALFQLGMNHLVGDFFEQNDQAAAAYFRQAAEGGLCSAEYEYGLALYHGRGVPRDVPAGLAMIRKAASGGSYFAQEFVDSLS